MNRLYPRPGETSPEEVASRLDLASRAPEGRPYLVLNMVASLDGKATVEGATRGLSTQTDRLLFHHLRTQADAVLVGAGTARAERYGPATKTPELRAKREHEGLEPEPLLVIASYRLELSPSLPALAEPGARVAIATAAEQELEDVRADVTYLRTGDDLRLMLARLREEHGIRSVLCEGGPTLNAHLFAAGLVDELFMTLSPQVVGGAGALTLVAGRELIEPAGAELLSVYEADGELFTRWRFR